MSKEDLQRRRGANDALIDQERERSKAIVDAWFLEHFNNWPHAFGGSEAQNHIRKAVDDLRERLSKE